MPIWCPHFQSPHVVVAIHKHLRGHCAITDVRGLDCGDGGWGMGVSWVVAARGLTGVWAGRTPCPGLRAAMVRVGRGVMYWSRFRFFSGSFLRLCCKN